MFTKNIPIILEKGIKLENLLSSKIFNVLFDYDDWPSNHYNEEKCIKPYNGSIFHLRFKYREIFKEDNFRSLEEVQKSNPQEIDGTKISKIQYSINLLL